MRLELKFGRHHWNVIVVQVSVLGLFKCLLFWSVYCFCRHGLHHFSRNVPGFNVFVWKMLWFINLWLRFQYSFFEKGKIAWENGIKLFTTWTSNIETSSKHDAFTWSYRSCICTGTFWLNSYSMPSRYFTEQLISKKQNVYSPDNENLFH